jgi:hypothetical protein|tara:strand:+ start:7495 stop:7728 length:234 start_codon:yes stop_codon:yes gene_type:complete
MPEIKSDKEFQAEQDMHTLAEAEALERNPARKAAAVTRARERAAELTQFADHNAAKEKVPNGATGLGLAEMQQRKKR